MQARQRIGGVGAVAVKEMLGVKQGFALLRHQMGNGRSNCVAVFIQGDVQGGGDVKIMGFADQAHGGGLRVQNRRQNIVVFGTAPHPFGHPERRHRGAGVRRVGEKV